MQNRKNVAVLLRTFAKTPDKVQGTVEKLVRVIKTLLPYSGWSWSVTSILIAVPTGGTFKDSDCGELSDSLLKALNALPSAFDCLGIHITESDKHDLFVGLQNYAASFFIDQEDCDVMITIAPSAFEAGYFDLETAEAMMEAFDSGAKVVPVAVPEDGIDEFVARGTAGGPIIGWDLDALDAVNGFDLSAAQPKKGEENPNAGCEEIHPIIRMFRKYGPCYAPISPRNVAGKKRELTGDDLARHQKQIASKTERQLAHAKSLGVEEGIEFFTSVVMPQYQIQPTLSEREHQD